MPTTKVTLTKKKPKSDDIHVRGLKKIKVDFDKKTHHALTLNYTLIGAGGNGSPIKQDQIGVWLNIPSDADFVVITGSVNVLTEKEELKITVSTS